MPIRQENGFNKGILEPSRRASGGAWLRDAAWPGLRSGRQREAAHGDRRDGLHGPEPRRPGSIKIPKVVGASKYEQKTTEAPSSISIIPRDDLRRYGHRTLADALQSLQGFHVSNDRNYSFLGPRGIDLGDFNSRTLLLVDGHRVNNNLTDGAALGSEFILDLDLVERVEVIRGPGSVL